MVTAHRGASQHALLFDTGPEPYAFRRNCERLAIDLGRVEGIVLSHGHFDHGGGLVAALDSFGVGNGHRPVPGHVHPDMFRPHAMMLAPGTDAVRGYPRARPADRAGGDRRAASRRNARAD
ncbi:MAG: MBL fold metallo-hydrolase [Alphaproteobacteria bacterium]|nr:MBL fold metallo-hydrolase [Alphaproteobacteria bacterium]